MPIAYNDLNYTIGGVVHFPTFHAMCDVIRGRNCLFSAGRGRGESSHSSGVPVLITDLLLHLRVRQRLQERGPEVISTTPF